MYKHGEQTHGQSVSVYTEYKLLFLDPLIATRPPDTNENLLGVFKCEMLTSTLYPVVFHSDSPHA